MSARCGPSLKDPLYRGQPTAEVLALCSAEAFAPWLALPDAKRPPEYLTLKARIQARLLAQFMHHFPALAPMLRFQELATPVTQRHHLHAVGGAMYGIEMSAERLTSPALHVRTPLPGLWLAGQDVISPGVPGAFMGGLLAAASIEPALWTELRA
jgi:all-trans-retinol 13,14-reductase